MIQHAANAQGKRRSVRGIDLLVTLLLALLLTPAFVALSALPFAAGAPGWVAPTAAVVGLALGLTCIALPAPRRWWGAALSYLALLLGVAATEAVIVGQQHIVGSSWLITFLLGAYTTALGATAPWLMYRAKQPWLAVVITWATIAGAWGTHLSSTEVWWVIFLLVTSFTLLGMWRLREETTLWHALDLEQIGPVFWPSARAILAVSLLVALLGLIPLGAVRLGQLSHALQNRPLAAGGPFSYDRPTGTPVAVLGAPLTLTAPDVSSRQIILTYTILSSDALHASAPTPSGGAAPSAPAPNGDASPLISPLLGATLDTFNGSTWMPDPQSATRPAPRAFPLPTGAAQVRTRVTVYSTPATSGAPLLLGVDQPLSFTLQSGNAQTRVVGGSSDTSPLAVADWEASHPLASGDSYTVTSAILPGTATGVGSLPPDLLAILTQTPTALTSSLSATAHALVTPTTPTATPAAQAQALITAMETRFTLDQQARPPAGSDAVSWFLQQRHGNVLLWTTTFILLCRALGLPMRLAEGYLPGSYDPHYGQEVVRASDATVWAQLAIPGDGWLDLLPTAKVVTVQVPAKIIYTGQPSPSPITRQTPTPPQQHARQAPQRAPVAGQQAQPLSALLPALALIILLIAGALAALTARWRGFGAQLGPLNQFFARVSLLAKLAGVRLRSSDTATQATEKVAAYVLTYRQTLIGLNTLYERTRYGPADEHVGLPNLHEQWRRLSGVFWRLALSRPFRRRSEPARARTPLNDREKR